MLRENFLDRLAAADQQHRSWRKKLAWLRDLLADPSFVAGEKELVYLAVYLRYLATGAIPCEEDGGHYRPSHHARLSEEIHRALAKYKQSENRSILRRIYPYLPSFDEAFTRREPLTRIRDIAHRNDIPQDLKREIKTRLQNKLHRCADPQDLATSREILQRVAAQPGDYPAAFVEQFKIFHAELEEFFGARALALRLSDLAENSSGKLAELSRRYRDLKVDFEGPQPALERIADQSKRAAAGGEQVLKLLSLGVELRRELVREQQGYDDRSRRCRLVDIGLTGHAFVLAGQFRSLVTPCDDQEFLPLALVAIERLLSFLELDDWEPAAILARELGSWRHRFEVNNRDHLLRLKAFVDRVEQRVREQADSVLARYVEPAERLGQLLKVPSKAVTAFTEGDLRGGLSFQLSALAELVASRVRRAANLSPWVALYVGKAKGRLVRVRNLAEVRADEPTIALVDQASGDETIPQQVRGVILGHEIPQLSHLGVRVRQSNVVFACCDESAPLSVIAQHEGRWVELAVSPRDAQVLPAVASRGGGVPRPVSSTELALEPRITAGGTTTMPRVVLLTEQTIDPDEGGRKAAAVGQLYRLSRVSDSFAVPRAMVLPYDVLATQLSSQPELAAELAHAADVMATARDEATRTVVRVKVRSAIRQLEVPAELMGVAERLFGSDARLMVRSSACLEDGPGGAGAGVYESVANVPLSAIDDAVRQVWASLWNDRAVASREQAGIDHGQARMAVLVQELVSPDLSFIMHTVNPISGNADEVTLELAVGHGEVLAAASARGTPFRLVCNKKSGHVVTEAFASYDKGLWPAADGGLEERPVDYSEVPLMGSSETRRALGRRLAEIAQLVERELGTPQDVEGVVSGDTIYLVQSRAQQGLATTAVASDEGSGPVETLSKGAPLVPIFGLFEKQIDGDDTLFALAQRRFRAIGLAAEFHAGDPQRLEELWRYSPQDQAMLHLPRGVNLLHETTQSMVLSFAGRFAGRLRGMVIHDQWEMVGPKEEYLEAVEQLSARLARIDRAPLMQIEFAVGLQPEEYIGFFENLQGMPKIGACLDIGHVGIWYARRYFAGQHAGEDVCALTPYDARLPELIADVETASSIALDRVLAMIRQLGAWGVPTHFHLHDGHPLWTLSPYRECDHMSFLEEISIPFERHGSRSIRPLYGPEGLAEIVYAALSLIGRDKVTATLEIHPMPGRQRLPPEDAALFGHWREKNNAEEMNYWLSILSANFELLKEIFAEAVPVRS